MPAIGVGGRGDVSKIGMSHLQTLVLGLVAHWEKRELLFDWRRR